MAMGWSFKQLAEQSAGSAVHQRRAARYGQPSVAQTMQFRGRRPVRVLDLAVSP